ncbi:MAG TPA: PH domain-containing protein [Streptosporangiaceae bacterium]|nr:PH domain-containing protein [Streptosporangiaceae bacterium]
MTSAGAAADDQVPGPGGSADGVVVGGVGVGVGPGDTGWLRLSPRSLIVRPLTDLVRLVPLLAGLLLLHSGTGGRILWGLLAALAAVVTGLIHWATTRYRITDERVYVRRGLFSTKLLSVARDRIRTVDVTAHLLHRVLGVCRVSIGTGRNDLRPGESFHLDGLTRADAETLRITLLASGASGGLADVAGLADAAGGAGAGVGVGVGAGVGVASVGGQTAPVVVDRDLVRLRLSWLRFAPLTMTGLVVVSVLFGAVIQIINATNVTLTKTGPVKMLVSDFAALDIVQRVLVGSAVAVVFYVVVALIGYVAVYWNFRLTEHGADTVRVTRGLLSLRATTISLNRLCGVEISEPMLLRSARGARCLAITTGLHVGRGAEHEGSVLVPPAPREVARQVTAQLLGIPEELCAGPLVRHGPAAFRRRLFRALLAAVVIILGITLAVRARHGPSWVWIGSFSFLPAAVAVAVDRYRNLGHRLEGGWLVTRTGSFARRRNIISTDAIIGWRIHQTWFQRRQGLMTLTATTAAGQQHYSLRDVPVDVGLAVADQATGELLAPFRQP